MKTIGLVIKDARTIKNFSYTDLERETKIKEDFLKSIESESWAKLPEYPVVVGFIKNIAGVLGINKEQAVAILRRDYPPGSRTAGLSPKPDIKDKFSWSPKLTFIAGVVVVFLMMASYLTFQYVSYIKPPELAVDTPQEGQVIMVGQFLVSGKSDEEAAVTVNNQPAFIDEGGNFTAEIDVVENTKSVIVVARSRTGKESTIERSIVVEKAK